MSRSVSMTKRVTLVRLYLPHGVMRRASGTEPVVAGMEAGFPFRADDLRDGLPDKFVYHGGDARWLLPYVGC